ncbi:vWA domain-containing protein [Desulforhopalus sp. 52FAK]
MFVQFFYTLRDAGVPVSPTSFLTLHKALAMGLVTSLDDLYSTARTVLVKSEKYFDLYDQVFSHIFAGTELVDIDEEALELLAGSMVNEWLKNPKELADALGVDRDKLSEMSPEEVLEYFKKRLKDQEGRHDGGSKWIGTGGVSPVGHGGNHPGGLRVGGTSRNKSALKVAGERRYKNYSSSTPLTVSRMGEALKKLRNLVPRGPKDSLNIDETIRETIRKGGEIDLVFERGVVDRLKVILLIDNGGWSMDPHVQLVQTLFNYAKSEFKDLQIYYFHNTVYDLVWEDPGRYKKALPIADFIKNDPDTRCIVVGDASMAPYELMSTDGSIYAFERSGKPSVEQLKFVTERFPHSVWLNPIPAKHWPYTHTIKVISSIFPMYELSLDGLEGAVNHLMGG